jgi:hypothetical protein
MSEPAMPTRYCFRLERLMALIEKSDGFFIIIFLSLVARIVTFIWTTHLISH